MRRGATLGLVLWLAACTAPAPPPSAGLEPPSLPPAVVTVEIMSGFTLPPSGQPARPGHVELVLDLSASMRTEIVPGTPRYAAARRSAEVLIEGLRTGTTLGVRALGLVPGDACASATSVVTGELTRREELIERIGELEPQGESSLAAALSDVSRKLRNDSRLDRTRVVVFTDLGDECGGDVCAAAADLVAGGALLDLVVLGDTREPACLAGLAPDASPPIASQEPRRAPPRFSVESYSGDGSKPPVVLATGQATGERVRVPAGSASVRVEFDVPSLIGPLALSPGSLTRVTIIDFPTLDPSVRESVWNSEALDAADPLRGESR